MKQPIWEKIGKICLYLLVVFTPLFFLPLAVASLEINKQIFAGLLVLIAFVCYLVNSFDEKGKIIYPKSLLSLAVIILLAVLGASAFFSKAKIVSLYGNMDQSDSVMSFLIYGLVFFTTAVFFSAKDRIFNWANRLGLLFFGGLALTTIFGLFQIFGQKIEIVRQLGDIVGFNTVGSLLNWAIYSAFGLVVIIAVLFWGDMDDTLNMKKQFGLVVLGLLIVGELVILNYSAVWLALVLVILFLAAYKFITLSKLNPALIIIISVFLFFGVVGRSFPSLANLPMEFRPNLATTFEVIKGGATFPQVLIGSGPATFGYDYSLYRPLELNKTNLWQGRFNQGFSFLMTLFATTGILGVLAMAFVVFCFIWQIRQAMSGTSFLKKQVGPIALGIIFLLISWLFAPNFFTQAFFIFFGLGLITASSNSVKEVSLTSFSKFSVFIFFIVLIIFITGVFTSIFIVGKKYIGLIYYYEGFRANQAGDIDNSLIKLDKAVRMDPEQDKYFRDLSQLLLVRVDTLASQVTDNSVALDGLRLEVQNTAAVAIQIASQAAKINPNDSFNWSNLGNVYERLMPIVAGADSFVEENYQKAMALDPNNPHEPVNLARSFLVAADLIGDKDANLWQEKLNKARSYFEESIYLKSDYAPAHFLLAAVAMREGKVKEAIQKLEFTKQFAPFDASLNFQLGVIYYQDNQLEKAKLEFQRAVGNNPNHSNTRYFLGLIYDQLGNKTAALDQFKIVAGLNPDNVEVKKIVDNLQKGRSALEGIVPPAKPPEQRLEAPVAEINIEETNPSVL